jgi:hypothetical protein
VITLVVIAVGVAVVWSMGLGMSAGVIAAAFVLGGAGFGLVRLRMRGAPVDAECNGLDSASPAILGPLSN